MSEPIHAHAVMAEPIHVHSAPYEVIETGGSSDHSELENRDIPDQHPMSSITGLEDALDGKADASDIPTKTSDLVNDSGFLTEHQSLDGYATEEWVEGQGYLTEHQSLAAYSTTAQMNAAISAAIGDAMAGEY